MRTLKIYFIGVLCSLCLISCSEDEDILAGHGSVTYEEVTYPLDYAVVGKQRSLAAIINGEFIRPYDYFIDLFSKNYANKVSIRIHSDREVTLPELSGEYSISGFSIYTLGESISVNMSGNYHLLEGISTMKIVLEQTGKKTYSLKINWSDIEDFIIWEGPFYFQ